jgi:hypothetical protein
MLQDRGVVVDHTTVFRGLEAYGRYVLLWRVSAPDPVGAQHLT